MSTQQARGGIERKILTSILWVGVIPMGLALLIGWIFAYQGQQLAVSQELNTAARAAAGGVELALRNHIREFDALTQDENIHSLLDSVSQGVVPDVDQFDVVFRNAENLTGRENVAYYLYDAEGSFLGENGVLNETSYHGFVLTDSLNKIEYLDFRYIEGFSSYADIVIGPVLSRDGARTIGYLKSIRKNNAVLKYLYSLNNLNAEKGEASTYGLIHVGGLEQHELDYVIQWEEAQNKLSGPPEHAPLDRRLARKIRGNQKTDTEFTAIMKFDSPSGSEDAFMTYHRLLPYQNVYLLVYRTRADVVRYINIAAAVTLFVSLLVIGLFCIIAYRIVNNNIIRPVSLLNEGAQIIRQGDLELKLKIDTQDEIEELAMSFNQMATALKQNIYELEGSEERYRSLITSMRDGIFQADIPGNISLVNPAGVHILGYNNAEELIGITLKELFVEEIDYARVSNDLVRNQYIERTRVWMKKRNSPAVCIELAISRIYDDAGEYVGMEGTFRDVTRSVQLEKESKERSERIAAINQIANAINSSLEAGRVFDSIVHEVRKLVSFDYAAVALLEDQSSVFETRQLWPEAKPSEQTIRVDDTGSCAAWVARERQCLTIQNIQEDHAEFSGQFPEYISSCLCVPLYATGRIVGTLNLGSKFIGAFSYHEVEVVEQMSPHVAVAIRNAKLLENLQMSLEEVTRAREKLHDVNEELKTLDDLKTNLLSNVSHELRTPLVAVMGYTDMILNGKVGPINDVQLEYLEISLRNIEKLVTLIENLLDFSKLHRGDDDLLFDTFDLIDCAQNALQTVKPVADSRDIVITMDVPDEPVLVEGDKGKMGQVFNNLLSNAVKFNENGGNITIKMKFSDDTVDVSVTDTGIGIPLEKQDKIFTRFYQVDGSSTRKYGGTGIGLSIAQDIMRLHGASIVFTSEPGKGTSFRFILPLSGRQRRLQEEAGESLPLPTETHLLIELVTQDRAMSNQIRSLLLSEGMDVIHAAYPAVAIQLANKYTPDCILLDSEAGPMGSMVLEEILSDPSASNFPIVLLTNDEALSEKYNYRLAAQIKRSFRKSTLLSGIHYALSRGISNEGVLGNKVLCVDDDPEIVRFISRCLESEGLETDQCSTGEEAIEKLQSMDYWLVLLDISMPGIDGWETCRRIKSEASLAGLHVYFVTAKPIEKNISKVHECGADGYLLKPFKPEELISIIDGYEWRQSGDIGRQEIEQLIEDVSDEGTDA